jgi:hypothetical protein
MAEPSTVPKTERRDEQPARAAKEYAAEDPGPGDRERRDFRDRLAKAAHPELVSIPMEEYRALIGLREVAGQYLEIKLAGKNPPELIVPAREALAKAVEQALAASPQARALRGD